MSNLQNNHIYQSQKFDTFPIQTLSIGCLLHQEKKVRAYVNIIYDEDPTDNQPSNLH